ncbi:MAG TPA: prolipoprotein diacylglyceryl transferase [Rhodothermales bacterium]|nr:prolipoprotein diacylglyceryl transferase [Rhodothermales bacterium]HRR08122.1 prolipoprotein diacylglyceryl transferase [Rhodothermales bacterium]
MYPRISDMLRAWFGIDFPLPIYTYGFMLAVAILTASALAGRELKRLQKIGKLGKLTEKVKDKNGRISQVAINPSDLMSNITIIAAIAGVIGSKVFYILESPGGDVVGKLFSSGGLTFYGGLIFGTASVLYYVHKKGITGVSLPVFMDALAPTVILAYGIGRIGCHLSGDGDWGIPANMALKPDFLPAWLWAETYPGNIAGEVIAAPGVYPTPLWEFMACFVIFGVLMALRNHPFKPGWVFSLYLLLNGLERFLIEKVRVNARFDFLGFQTTQAELIASILIVAGIVGLLLTTRKAKGDVTPAPTVP